MNYLKAVLVTLLMLATASIGPNALAYGGHHGYGGHHHGGARVGVFIGAPVLGFGLPYYGYPGYGYAPYGAYGYAPYGYYGPTSAIVAPAAPPVYIEQSNINTTGPASDGNWYYCSNPDGYYPYVRECPNGWQRVPSQPVQR